MSFVSEVEEYLKKLNGVKNYHVSISRSSGSFSFRGTRDKLMIRLWVDKEMFDAQVVLDKLSDSETFEDKIKAICMGQLVPQYDIYYT